MSLPFIPGNCFNKNLGKTKFHKSHHLDMCSDEQGHILVEESKAGIGGECLPSHKGTAPFSSIPRGTGSDLPTWVAFDKQVLSFDGYFQESVVESRDEQFCIRRVKIYFFLEDDSMMIVEPRTRNSALPQGTILKRHRVKKPPPNDDLYYRADDFNMRAEIEIHGRVFKICHCDEFTANFLRRMGVRLEPRLEIPDDQYIEGRKASEEVMQGKRPVDKSEMLRQMQFLCHDRHVLKFFCFWDDRDSMFGDVRELIMHYFLSDDTIEVAEVNKRNSGRDHIPMLLRRAKLPKAVEPMKRIGEDTRESALNVIGTDGFHCRYVLDPLNLGIPNQEFYKDHDITIGSALNIWGWKVVVYDCDEFTKEYYKVKYGITDFTPLAVPGVCKTDPEWFIPPYNGFGSEEDSLGYCFNLMPKPPQRDFVKFMAHDRRGFDGNVLRFLARLDTDVSVDVDRRFIVSYFRTDDTILIHEPPVENSGFTGGTFLARGRVMKPGQERFKIEFSEYYTGCDFYIGNILNCNEFKFVLLDADDYAYTYMEKHCDEFPQSDVKRIMSKLSQLLSNDDIHTKFQENSHDANMPFEKFCNFMRCVGREICLTEHDVITLARYYHNRVDDPINMEELLSHIHVQLKRANFEDFQGIQDNCEHHDGARTGWLEQNLIRSTLLGCRVPAPMEAIEKLLKACGMCDIDSLAREDGLVNYSQFVCFINWRRRPIPPIVNDPPTSDDSSWAGGYSGRCGKSTQSVNFRDLFQDMQSQHCR